MSEPLVSIIIPHFNGKEILHRCLNSLEKTRYPNKEIILVDNASTDDSVDKITESFPWLKIVTNQTNLGYAGGCNSGLSIASGEYVLFLNNDTTHEPDWLDLLVSACEQDERIAACQPKILDQKKTKSFDYAGAAGGLLDIFGYPFTRGRIFLTVEKDEGQYDEGGDIFWASGAATLIRRTVLDKVGLLDEDFFAHMEEIDLNWRMHLAGFRVIAVPQAMVYHNAGSTLSPASPEKIFLNHRNSITMLLKNYHFKNLLWILPFRLMLECATMFYALLKFDFNWFKGVLLAVIYIMQNFFRIWKKRTEIAAMRNVSDSVIIKKMYRGSIAVDYFIRGIRRTQDLGFAKTQ